MTTYDLKIAEPQGNRDPLNRRHFVNGRRVGVGYYLEIERLARVRGVIDSFANATVGGERWFYSVARVPSEILPETETTTKGTT